MKLYILAGAVAIAIITLVMMQAVAAAEQVTAMGTVVDELGRPVPGATVRLIDENYRELGTTTSDANGNFRLVNVELASSSILKAKVSLNYNRTTYTNRLENMQWYDASQGILSFNANDTRLYGYPVSDHGYIWGSILDSATNGKLLDGTVYLVSGTTTIAADAASNGYYQIEAAPGDYEIYAVHPAGDYQFMSNRTKITIAPAYTVEDSAPMVLVADQATSWMGPVIDQATPLPTPHLPPVPPSAPEASPAHAAKAIPLAAALALGLVMIIAGWAFLGRKE